MKHNNHQGCRLFNYKKGYTTHFTFEDGTDTGY